MRRVLAACLVVALGAVAGCGSDAPSHRAEVEDVLGHPVTDWPAYLQHAHWRCSLEREAFGREITQETRITNMPGMPQYTWLKDVTDYRVLDSIGIDTRRLCPERLQEVEQWQRSRRPA